MPRKSIKSFTKLSVLIPVYNEQNTVEKLVKLVVAVSLKRFRIEKELIIVDDCSTDNTRKILKKLEKKYKDVKIYFHKKNSGKGAAIKTAIRHATGEIMIVQDADLEYDPNDYLACIEPIIKGKALVVYGSRRLKLNQNQYSGVSYYIGGVFITWFFVLLYWQHITDEPTCYKTFRSDVIRKIRIVGDRFEWEPEVTAKIAKQGIKILEVPISYHPRHVAEGKKIRWKDGVQAVYTLLKYRFMN